MEIPTFLSRLNEKVVLLSERWRRTCLLWEVKQLLDQHKSSIGKHLYLILGGHAICLGLKPSVYAWLAKLYLRLLRWLLRILLKARRRHIVVACGVAVAVGAALSWQYKHLGDGRDIRHRFIRWEPKAAFKKVGISSHSNAGHERSEVRQLLYRFAEGTARPIFVYDPNVSDIARVERDPRYCGYSRIHYVDRDADLVQQSCSGYPPQEAMVLLTDSDYYRDMPNVAARNPCLFYTFIPELAAGGGETAPLDGVYDIGEDDRVNLQVTGGAKYSHPVWNWFIDHFSVDDLLGRTIVKVEQRRISPHRFVVYTEPVAWIPKYHWGHDIYSDYGVVRTCKAQNLERMKYYHHGVIAVRYLNTATTPEDYISLTMPGFGQSVELPYATYYTAHSTFARAKEKTTSTLERMLSPFQQRDDTHAVTKVFLLREVLLALEDRVLVLNRIAQTNKVHKLYESAISGRVEILPDQGSTKVDTEDPRPLGRPVGPQIIPGPVLIDDSKTSQQVAIDQRITEPAPEATPKAVVRRYRRYAELFVQHLFPNGKGICTPASVDELREHFDKPAQQRCLDRVGNNLCVSNQLFKIVSSFIKAETSANPSKPPRIISQVSDEHKCNWSMYTLPVSKLMKDLDCYAFGKKPEDVAARVHYVASKAETLTLTDFSKFDGTRSDVLHECEKLMIKYFYHESYHAAIDRLFDSEVKKSGILPKAGFYKIGFQRLSGTPGTSLFNSLVNMFCAFCALMRSPRKEAPGAFGGSNNPSSAVKNLGIYGGDDGFTPDVCRQKYVDVARELGLKLTVESSRPSNEPVTFLARIYPDPKNHPGSCSDVKRVLGKIHFTCSDPLAPVQLVWARKAQSLLVTDPETPLLKELTECLNRNNPFVERAAIELAEKKIEEFGYIAAECVLQDSRYPVFPDREPLMRAVLDNLGWTLDMYETVVLKFRSAPSFDKVETVEQTPPDYCLRHDTIIDGVRCPVGSGVKAGRFHWRLKVNASPAPGPEIQSPPNDSPVETMVGDSSSSASSSSGISR